MGKNPRLMLLGGMVALSALIAGLPAAAHLVGHNDSKDVRGDLDIRRAEIARDGRQLDVKVATHERFQDRDLAQGGFYVDFDSRGGPRTDFTLRMDLYEGSYPYCTLYDKDGFSRQGATPERRPRSMTCSITRSELEPERHIRWRVRSDSGIAIDRAPNSGWFSH